MINLKSDSFSWREDITKKVNINILNNNIMKTKTIIFGIFTFLLFFTGIIVGDKSIVHNEIYNSFGRLIMVLALIIIITSQRIEISKLKKRIQELEDKN